MSQVLCKVYMNVENKLEVEGKKVNSPVEKEVVGKIKVEKIRVRDNMKLERPRGTQDMLFYFTRET